MPQPRTEFDWGIYADATFAGLAVLIPIPIVDYYWHRAFLLDYMLLAGHLDDEEAAHLARQAMEQVLDTATTSPLIHLARQVAASPRHILRTLRRARQGSEDEVIQQKRSQMQQRWADFEDYLRTLAAQYDRLIRK